MKNTLFDLSGKIAIITGAAGLLGKQHARALLDAGATVVITDVSIHKVMPVAESLKASYGEARIVALEMDVTSHDDVSAVRSKLAQDGFSPSILINNAAIDAKVDAEISGLETSRLENFSMTQWQLEMDVGLKGALICSQVFGVEMASGGKGGVILNIASDLSVISPDQRLYRREGVPASEQPVKPVTYSVIKAGLVGLTKYLATYWADSNVRCNALSPGGVFNGQNAAFVDRVQDRIPMGRMADLDEYHGAIQFLCSDASSYMNGQNIVIDGGRTIW